MPRTNKRPGAAGYERPTKIKQPGVTVYERLLPSGHVSYRARYVDPESSPPRRVWETLPSSLTQELRVLWTKRKSRELADRKREIERGAVRSPKRTSISDAVTQFLAPRPPVKGFPSGRPGPRTLERYSVGVRAFERWARREGIEHTEDLTRDHLGAFRAAHMRVLGGPKPVRGGRRGERSHAPSAVRSLVTINTELTAVKIMLNDWRRAVRAPRLSSDDIADRLRHERVARSTPEYLSPGQIRELLAAAEQYDAAGLGTHPIRPFALFLLLTGMRRGEALAVEWRDIDLDARDPHGAIAGEIRLRAETTKTKRERTIGLEVSPMLRQMLRAMRLEQAVGRVFATHTAESVDAARTRLIAADYDAPAFTWQVLRATCATYLTCSSGIWGSATVFLSARQLGHSVAVAEGHYLGTHRGVPREARTLEAAMQIESTKMVDVAVGLERFADKL